MFTKYDKFGVPFETGRSGLSEVEEEAGGIEAEEK